MRVLTFTRNDSFRKKLPLSERDLFAVLGLDELRLCPSWAEHVPTNATQELVERESRKTVGRWGEALGKRFERKDSIKLLEDVAEILFEQFQTFSTPEDKRQYPSFSDIYQLVETRAYRKYAQRGKSKHEESLTLALSTWQRWGRDIFNSRKGMPWLQMVQEKNLIIETGMFRDEDAFFIIEFLLGSLWQAKVYEGGYTEQLELVIVLDDPQRALDRGSVVERMIRESRHAGWTFILGPQNVGRISPDILGNCGLFILVGAMSGKTDVEQARALMGLRYRDDLFRELFTGERGKVLARQPMGAYKEMVSLNIPHLPESDYSEQERQQRLNGWPSTLKWTQPEPVQEQDPVTSVNPETLTMENTVEAFVRDANEKWWAPMEIHFAAAGVRDGSMKMAVSQRAIAMGYTLEPEEGRVMGMNGRRIQLTQVNELARERFDLQIPKSYHACRGSLSTRYYQHTVSKLIKNNIQAEVELEGKVGKDLKRVDVLARLHDGKVIAIEFASTKNAEYEIHNIRALKDNPKLIVRYIIICETLKVRDRVTNQLEQAGVQDPKVLVCSFYEFTRNAKSHLENHGGKQ